MKRFYLAVTLAVAVSIGATTDGAAQSVKLIFTSLQNPASRTQAMLFRPWVESINKAAEGSGEIDDRPGTSLANNENVYDRVFNDVVQMALLQPHYVAGKFLRTSVAGLPFIVDQAEAGSVALWRLYKTGLLDAEYDEVVPMLQFVFPQSELHMAKPLKSLDSLRGLKLITPGKGVSEAAAALDATPLSLPSADIFSSLQRGTADGTIVGWPTFNPRKLHEVTFFHVDAPLGGPTVMIFMARKKYAALPAQLRSAIDDNAGEAGSRLFGAAMGHEDDLARQEVTSMANHAVVRLDAAQAATWRRKLAPIEAQWVKDTPDGQAVLARFKSILTDVEKGASPK